ncbi:MAG: hypothetical protein AAFY64_04020, partial [Pseudomonadota bacterium]
IASYNHGNPQNLLALTTLAQVARKSEHSPGAMAPSDAQHPSSDAAKTQAIDAIPPLPKLADLTPDLANRVTRMAARHGNSDKGVIPSLYLHLTLFPDVLAETDRRLAGYVGSPEFDADKAALSSAVAREAQTLSAALSPASGRPAMETLEPFLATATAFTRATIPDLILVGHQLAPPEA